MATTINNLLFRMSSSRVLPTISIKNHIFFFHFIYHYCVVRFGAYVQWILSLSFCFVALRFAVCSDRDLASINGKQNEKIRKKSAVFRRDNDQWVTQAHRHRCYRSWFGQCWKTELNCCTGYSNRTHRAYVHFILFFFTHLHDTPHTTNSHRTK